MPRWRPGDRDAVRPRPRRPAPICGPRRVPGESGWRRWRTGRSARPRRSSSPGRPSSCHCGFACACAPFGSFRLADVAVAVSCWVKPSGFAITYPVAGPRTMPVPGRFLAGTEVCLFGLRGECEMRLFLVLSALVWLAVYGPAARAADAPAAVRNARGPGACRANACAARAWRARPNTCRPTPAPRRLPGAAVAPALPAAPAATPPKPGRATGPGEVEGAANPTSRESGSCERRSCESGPA